MKRRKLLKHAALASVGVAIASAGVTLAPRPPISGYASFAEVRAQLALWQAQNGAPLMRSGWPCAQVLAHCAQSIEFSLHGFPAPKPAWFRATVGPAAFSVFDLMGSMRHSLTEAIPGAPDLSAAVWPQVLERLETAIAAFEQHRGELMPHFAYGRLAHHDYERAHLMHFSQHMQLLQS